MLQLIDIKKDYKTAGQTVHALKGVNLRFRRNEFVSILGASGCGKTTMLNIIGGLDQYTSGDLVINGKSTKAYKDHDWDVYRNHRIGFVFQSYNLIPHQTVLGNVEIALTIAGLSKAERRQRAIDALKRVGLGAELNKRPNQLSGGQMQRVAIARALVNNPEILLADEPTGALDTVTSVQIMDLIREIAGERLVIMVTHNPELAEEYSSRIVRLQDGLVVSDSNPYEGEERAESPEEPVAKEVTTKPVKKKKREKSAMSYWTSLGLSARNLWTKKARTILTSFAGSIGIISVCLVLALSNGFNKYILRMEEDMLSSYPVEITEKTVDVDSIMMGMTSITDMPDLDKIGDRVYVNSFLTNMAKGMTVTNKLDENYVNYINSMDKDLYTAIHYDYGVSLLDHVYTDATFNDMTTGEPKPQQMSISQIKTKYTMLLSNLGTQGGDTAQYASLAPMITMLGSVVTEMPGTLDFSDERFSDYVLSQYDLLAGSRFPTSENEAVFVIGPNNDVTDLVLAQLGFISQDEFTSYFAEENKDGYIDFSTLLGKKYTLYYNDGLYEKNEPSLASMGEFKIKDKLPTVQGNSDENGVNVKITGILRLKDDLNYGCLMPGLNITEKLMNKYLDANVNSEIAKWFNDEANAQKRNRVTEEIAGVYRDVATFEANITSVKRSLGIEKTIVGIGVYTENFETKELLLDYLDEWNDTHEKADQVKYTDTVGIMMSMVQTMLNAVTYVLVAFTSISLVVSSVMIGIITYVSVVERVKEIGVLRSLGARKKDIKNLFNAETFIIGLTSGLIGVAVTYFLSIFINMIFVALTGISGLAALPWYSAVSMVVISVALTLISGLIPASAAAKKDPVIALRTE